MNIGITEPPPVAKAFRVVETTKVVIAIVGAGVSIFSIGLFNRLLDGKCISLNRKRIQALEFVKGTRRVVKVHSVDINALIVILGLVNGSVSLEVDGRLMMRATGVGRGRWAPLAIVAIQLPVRSGQKLFWPSDALFQVATADFAPLIWRILIVG